jgi:hypothetical protein
MQGINSQIKKKQKKIVFADGEDQNTLKAAIASEKARVSSGTGYCTEWIFLFRCRGLSFVGWMRGPVGRAAFRGAEPLHSYKISKTFTCSEDN